MIFLILHNTLLCVTQHKNFLFSFAFWAKPEMKIGTLLWESWALPAAPATTEGLGSALLLSA